MALNPVTEESLFAGLDAGCLVLTPNFRTCAQLLDRYGTHVREQGRKVCPTPSAYPVDIWIQQQFDRLRLRGAPAIPARTLLKSGQEHLIWQHIIGKSASGDKLLNRTATTRAVQEAWSLMHLWQIDWHELRHYGGKGTTDVDAFLAWSDDFAQYCRKRSLTTLVQVLELLIPRVSASEIELPDRLVVAGFRDPPPLYQALLDALTDTISDSAELTPPVREPAREGRQMDNAASEIAAAACWARDILAQNPQARVGVIVHDLHGRHVEFRRQFSRVFSNWETERLQAAQAGPYHISVTGMAGSHSLIHHALQLLALNRFRIPTLEVCAVLRSPYVAGAVDEETARGRLELLFRKRNLPHLSTADIRYFAGREQHDTYAPLLAGNLLAFDQLKKPGLRRQDIASWSSLFEEQLAVLGWPGERAPSSGELSALATWSDMLTAFRGLNNLFEPMSLEEALTILGEIAGATALRESANNAPVQVVTPIEAEGVDFTHAWMTGLSERQWPPQSRPSPFIPYAVQKARHIPAANIGMQCRQARQMLQGLVNRCSEQVVFSYPARDDDITLRPSAMLTDMTGSMANPGEAGTAALHPLASSRDTRLERFRDPVTVQVEDSEKSGNSQLLADQADCPFRSFGNRRLGMNVLEQLTPGLSARDAGTLVHLVLEMFWDRLRTQEALLTSTPAEIESLLGEVIDAAVREMASRHLATMTPAYCALEKQRLTSLLLQWLEEEKKRGSFTVIGSEANASWQHGDLRLNLRIDRIDRTADGGLVLIDYKTSRSTAIDWEDDRPVNSQLMQYYLSVAQQRGHQEPVTGVFFAQVNIETGQLKGVARDDDIFPGAGVDAQRGKKHGLSAEANWEGLLRHWESTMAGLVEEFLSGYVAVAPRDGNSCRYCHVRPACRIDDPVGRDGSETS